MRSSMQSTPLLISSILDYGTTVHAASQVVTWTADGPRRSTYGEMGRDCKRLANALRALGIDADQRVATFMWNNEEHLEDDPEKFDDGWLRTGDVGTLTPDGFLRLTDRAKDVIKSGGEWISSVDLENVLMGHPRVKEASVVGVPDERWGERPLATVLVVEGESLTAEELRDYLASHVARWQVPERWAFLAEVPKTSVGKFDKKVIRRSYADGALEVTTL